MSEQTFGQETSETKRFKVTAVIKFTQEIGVFAAASKQEAEDLAMKTPEWYRASQYPGGVYDIEFEEQP